MIKIKLEFLRRNSNKPYDQPIKVEVVDVAPLPAIMVPTAAQGPPQPGNPGAGQPGEAIPPGFRPGQPGAGAGQGQLRERLPGTLPR